MTAQKNFRRLMRWIAERDDVEITTYRRLMEEYGRQKEVMTWGELVGIAENALETGSLAPTGDYSPAEIFAALARALKGFVKDRTLRDLTVAHPLGPLEMPPAEPEVRQVRLDDVWTLAYAADEYIGRTGRTAGRPRDRAQPGSGPGRSTPSSPGSGSTSVPARSARPTTSPPSNPTRARTRSRSSTRSRDTRPGRSTSRTSI